MKRRESIDILVDGLVELMDELEHILPRTSQTMSALARHELTSFVVTRLLDILVRAEV